MTKEKVGNLHLLSRMQGSCSTQPEGLLCRNGGAGVLASLFGGLSLPSDDVEFLCAPLLVHSAGWLQQCDALTPEPYPIATATRGRCVPRFHQQGCDREEQVSDLYTTHHMAV